MRTLTSVAAGLAAVVSLGSASLACNTGSSAPAQTPAPAPAPYYAPQGQPPYQGGPQGQPAPYYGPQGSYPQQPAPYGAPPYGPAPQPSPPAPAPPPQAQLLPPLVGVQAQQQEVRMILTELVNALGPADRAKVQGIPLTFEASYEVNAYAGCDDNRKPFMAATAGILEAADAIAQTRATDELFGTRTYDAYTSQVIPTMARDEKARAALPMGIVPTNLGPDLRRWSRAHQLFDEIIAFTMGHELAHHYHGDTGCANGQGMGNAPDPALLGRIVTRVITPFNQFVEAAADSSGMYDVLDAGRARRPQYAWTETGGLYLLDFFGRLERAGGGGIGSWLGSHPNAALRVPGLQTAVMTWKAQHPG